VLKAGATAAGLVAGIGLPGKAQAAEVGFIPPECRVPPGKEWFDQLREPGKPIVYTGANLRNIIFPLGGIGTGTVWLAGSGKLVNWQIFNNIQKNALVDDTFFAVRVEEEGKPPVVRVLRAQQVGPIKGFENISFCGRYPVATMTFKDDALPIDIELEAFNPLVPLDEKSSGLPCAIFTVRVKNGSQKSLKVTVLASVQNAVGHAGQGQAHGVRHETYGGNINQLVKEAGFTAIAMKAEPGKPARIDPPVELMVDHENMPVLADLPVTGLSMATVGIPKANASLRSVFWLANGDLRLLGGSVLGLIVDTVHRHGGFLLLSGLSNPLAQGVTATVAPNELRRETVFASFDSDNYGHWTVEGNAFGRGPSAGAAYDQSPVSGWTGPGLVNTFQGSDAGQGKLKSPLFTIRERWISFLIGGGNQPGQCCMNLVVNGQVVRTETGRNTEQLRRVAWDVADLAGRDATIEIVDQSTEGWGHVLVDDIRFSNLPIDAVSVADAQAWNAMIDELAKVDIMTPVSIGKGRAMLVPVELGTMKPGTDLLRQRDSVLSLVAKLADVSYQPAVGRPANAPSFGTMCLATPEKGCLAETAWVDIEQELQQFVERGSAAAGSDAAHPSVSGRTWNGALSRQLSLEADKSGEATFILAWHFPNQYYPQQSYRSANNQATLVGNMYANWFPDAMGVVRAVVNDLDNLRRKTYAFRDCMFNTTLPQYFVDAAVANASILRSPTCFWIKDGTFYGFEGSNPQGGGCCPMNCNHVWNYEQTLAKLWPAIERNMRETELKFNQLGDGAIRHRVTVPRSTPNNQMAVADGQCGAVLKAYREHLASEDRRFLDAYWPNIRKAMDFAIAAWDKDADGIMDAPQFNTYDRVIHGKNTFVSSLYLAALRAAEEMGRLSADEGVAKRYRELYEKGRKLAAETLYDGEYYIQIADDLTGGYGKGCCADQVVGQWWARILNLGDILPVEQVRSSLAAIFKYNWLWSQEGFVGTQRFRKFAEGKDKALLICSWPKGGRPEDPIYYRDEAWTGVEYQVAAHKLYEGQIDEALAIVRGARERYDGVKKSPWNEIECGDYYVRAMSAWSLLLAAQGYAYDGPADALAFNPRLAADNHRSFFSTADGWGTFSQKRADGKQLNSIAVAYGRCELAELRLGLPEGAKTVTGKAATGDRSLVANIAFDAGQAIVKFDGPTGITAGQTLNIELTW
jgi:uncharacterized protein (DUF608 family)